MYKTLRWYKQIGFWALWGSAKCVALMPHCVKYYVLKPFIASVLRLIGYRKRVIMGNLQRSFPQKAAHEIRTICLRYYDTMASIIIETMGLTRANKERYSHCVEWENREEMLRETADSDWVAMAAHYGCWEYFPMWCWQDESKVFLSVYHPLKSELFECFYNRLRALSHNLEQLPMQDALRYYLKHREQGKHYVIGLVSDQSPNLRADSHWYRFLNQDTVFNDGGALMAIKYRLPMYFAYAKRKSWGRYSVRLVRLYDGVEQLTCEELNERYVRILEQQIEEAPELWMWSHRRWKHTKSKQIRIFGERASCQQGKL